MRIVNVGDTGDCLFGFVFRQLYGEPRYHMNVRSTGVQFMRDNSERLIENSTDHSWSRYEADMSHQGTWVDAFVTQVVADALNLAIHVLE